jgi:hypothetical protein
MAGFNRLMGQLIRVDQVSTQLLEHLRHQRFATSNSARQSDKEHRISPINSSWIFSCVFSFAALDL